MVRWKKSKKKTTIRKKMTKRVMGLIMGMILVFVFLILSLGQWALKAGINLSLSALGNVAVQRFIGEDIDGVIKEGAMTEEGYNKIVSELEGLYNKAGHLIAQVYVIYEKSPQEWVYLAGIKEGEIISPHEDYLEVGGEQDQALETGTLKITKIHENDIYDQAYVTVFTPIQYEGKVVAMLGMDLLVGFLTKIKIFLGVGLFVLIALSMLIAWLIARSMARQQTKSIEVLVKKMKEMAHLEGDLTQRIQIDSNDEMGELAKYTNQMLDTIQIILLQVNNTSNRLVTTNETFTSSFEIAAAGYEQMNGTLHQVADRIVEQTQSMTQAVSQVEEIHEGIQQIANHAQEVSVEVHNTLQNAGQGQKIVKDLKNHVGEVVEVVDQSSKLVQHLGNLSEQITGIIDTITAIADQTNLLALNASIEAARAGEHGKGFAVVAEEVRKLAEESAESAEHISHLIQEVQNGIYDADTSMKRASQKTEAEYILVEEVFTHFGKIFTSIRNATGSIEEISGSTEEIAASSTLVTESVGQLATFSEENTASIEDIVYMMTSQNETIKALVDETVELEKVSLELKDRLKKLTLQ